MLTFFKAFANCSIVMISLYVFGYIIFGNKENLGKDILKKIIAFIVGTILHTIVFMYLTGMTKTLLLCIIFALTLKIIFNIKTIKVIFSTIIYTILLIIPDLITTALFINVFNVGKEKFYAELAGGIYANISVSIIMIILSLLLHKPLKKLINYKISTNKEITFISFVTLLVLGIFFYNLIKYYEYNNDVVNYLIIIVSLILILFYLFKQKINGERLQSRYDELLEIMKTYENDVEEQRVVFHETKNEIMIIKGKIYDKVNSKEILNYIDNVVEDKTKAMNSVIKYSKFKYLPSNGLKGFFYYKVIEAERKDVKVSVNISKGIEKSFLNALETNEFKQLTRVIGVYLDNAIEASSLTEEKKLGIEIYKNDKSIKMIISNTFNNDIDEEKIGNAKFSTKGKNRGHGLLLVKSILNNSKFLESKNEIIGNIFIQKLTIKGK